MPISVRQLLHLSLARASSVLANGDGVSLLQDMKTMVSVHHPKHNTAANLMESATSMLKHGATNDVVWFVSNITKEVADSIVPAIEHESAVSQSGLYTDHKEFFVTLNTLGTDLGLIATLNTAEESKSQQHKACRAEEAKKCTTKTDCDKDLYDYWLIWYNHEIQLHRDHGAFHGHFCLSNGTDSSIRQTSAVRMGAWIKTEKLVSAAELVYQNQVPVCQNAFTELETKNTLCNVKQGELEAAACAHANKVSLTVTTFHQKWMNDVDTYETNVNFTKHMQADRIREFTTLEVVKCLLQRVTEKNGAPCDDATDGLQEELTKCQKHRHNVDTTHLELIYPCIPPFPVACSSRSSLSNCMPVVQPHPCGAPFIAQEYAALPALPEAPFGMQRVNGATGAWRQTSCNVRPDCASCSPVILNCAATCALGEAACGACWSDLAKDQYCTHNPHASGCLLIPDADEFAPAGVCVTTCEEEYVSSFAYLDHSIKINGADTTVQSLVSEVCPFEGRLPGLVD